MKTIFFIALLIFNFGCTSKKELISDYSDRYDYYRGMLDRYSYMSSVSDSMGLKQSAQYYETQSIKYLDSMTIISGQIDSLLATDDNKK